MAAKRKKFSRTKAAAAEAENTHEAMQKSAEGSAGSASAAAAATSATFAATTSQESGRQQLTENEEAAAEQAAAESDRQTSVERDNPAAPTIGSLTPERSGSRSSDPHDMDARRRAMLEETATGTEDTSPEATAALSVFEQMTSGDRPSVGGFDNRLADLVRLGRPGAGDSRNDYDGSQTRPTNDDISTVFRVDIDKDPAVVVTPMSARQARVSPSGDIDWKNPDGSESQLNTETGVVTTTTTTETGQVVETETASGLPAEQEEEVLIIEHEEEEEAKKAEEEEAKRKAAEEAKAKAAEEEAKEAEAAEEGSTTGTPTGGGGIGDPRSTQERAKLAEYLRAQMGTQGGYRGGGDIDPSEHDDGRSSGDGNYSDPRDRLTGDGEEFTGGAAEGATGDKFDRVTGGQEGTINWGETGNNPGQQPELTEEVPSSVSRQEDDLSHIFVAESSDTSRLATPRGDTSDTRYSDDDDDEDGDRSDAE